MDSVRDWVLPLVTVEPTQGGLEIKRFLGTAFVLAGDEHYAATARHVVRVITAAEHVVALAIDETNSWISVDLEVLAEHPSEDVALLHLSAARPAADPSPFFISEREANASAHYSVWGYPEDALREVVEDGVARLRPDLVYSEGHIRRRLTGLALDSIRGSHFLELSTVAGGGFSGSPVVLLPPHGQPWGVVGIYVGERVSPTSGSAVGYATRIDALQDLLRTRPSTTQGQDA